MSKHFWEYVLFGIVYFVQGALSLTSVAMPIFLKDIMGLTIPQMTTLFAIASTPWVIKPIYGLISDYYPIKGLRRKPYLLAASLIASFGWFATAFNGTYTAVLLAQICAALGIAASDVFADGLAVEKSTPKRKGKIQSVCWGARSLGAVITGFFGGWLLNFVSPAAIFAATGVLPLLTFGVVLSIKETPYVVPKLSLHKKLKDTVDAYISEKRIWWVALFLFLWYVAPSFGTPLFFYLREALLFSETTMGLLASTVHIGGMLGAFLFWKVFDKVSAKKLLTWLVIINAAIALVFYLITNQPTAFAIYFINGILGIIVVIASMKLIVDVCPKGIEATTFALLTGITNLASNVVSTFTGGQLFALIGFKPLILVSAVISLIPLLFINKIFKK